MPNNYGSGGAFNRTGAPGELGNLGRLYGSIGVMDVHQGPAITGLAALAESLARQRTAFGPAVPGTPPSITPGMAVRDLPTDLVADVANVPPGYAVNMAPPTMAPPTTVTSYAPTAAPSAAAAAIGGQMATGHPGVSYNGPAAPSYGPNAGGNVGLSPAELNARETTSPSFNGRVSPKAGAVFGGLLGTVVGGPIGGILGALAGNNIAGRGMPAGGPGGPFGGLLGMIGSSRGDGLGGSGPGGRDSNSGGRSSGSAGSSGGGMGGRERGRRG